MEYFQLDKYKTTARQELLAGVISFITISYIILVNPLILSDAGIPPEWTILATVLTAGIGNILMGVWANVPLVLSPGMGENAFFAYTMVASLGLTAGQALTAVMVAGLLFMLTAYSGLISRFSRAIPDSLKKGITVGLGLFLVQIGLENSGLLVDGGDASFIAMGSLSEPLTLVALGGLVFIAVLVLKKIRGSFFIGILTMTFVALLGRWHVPSVTSFSFAALTDLSNYVAVIDFSGIWSLEFWLSVFSLTMLLIFGAIGMIEGLQQDTERAPRAFKAASTTVLLSGILGTSPVVPVAESAAGIKEGGRTGLTAVTTGVLFFCALPLLPLLTYIPSQALGPIIVITGASMVEQIRFIPMEDFSEWLPAFLILTIIPFTSSVVNGMAFGFILYPVMKLASGRTNQLNSTLIVIALLFLLTLVANTFI